MDSSPFPYGIINHTADLGIIVKGSDKKNLFIHAALAMTDLMVKGNKGNRKVTRDVIIAGLDFPDLMVKWLGEILYLFAGEKLIADSIVIRHLNQTQLMATIAFIIFEPNNHEILREIKAVTYHQISVRKVDDEWVARIIFDI
jgi:SHS2 domain-containing protein